jgi:hypothetical protein
MRPRSARVSARPDEGCHSAWRPKLRPRDGARLSVAIATVSLLIASQFLALLLAAGPAGAATSPPAVTGVNPIAGPASGGTSVVITGSDFSGATAVRFGSVAASSFTVNSPSQITAAAPAGSTSAPTVDVTVGTPAGTSATSVADEYTYTFSNNGYAVSLSTSAANPAVGGSVVLTATANQDVGPTPYGMSIFDASTNTELVHVGSGSTTSVSVSQSTTLAQRYVAYVCNAGGVNIQADSSPVTVAWGTPVPAPVVAGLIPGSGPTSGGTSVTISGSNLSSATAVHFGAGTGVITSDTASQLVVTAPAGTAGTVDVTVTTAGGTSATSAADQFTYLTAPVVSSVSPASGPTSGGTSVTIGGTNLSSATAVHFGTATATIVTDTASSLVATAPAGTAGTVDVTITTPQGTSASSAADRFSYVAPPAITAVSPQAGYTTGGTAVTITGTNLAAATAVRFGASGGSVVTDTATQIVATAPPGSPGTVNITVTTVGGTSPTSAADQYTYLIAPPAVTGISPASGPTGGGTAVTIGGTALSGASSVSFGPTAAVTFTVNSPTQITATAPAGTGTVDVTVTTAGGTSAISAADQFGYLPAPAVTGLSPASGYTTGATTVTITGTALLKATAVRFGTAPASISSDSATQIVVTAPAAQAGTVDVSVSTAGGTSATSAADQYTYLIAPPAVSHVSPASGPTAGGTAVTIGGTALSGASSVSFGTTAAVSFTVNSPTQITATAPAGTGTVDVTVTTPGGTSATSSADQYTYAAAPSVTSVAPSAGPTGGGTSVVITGTNLLNASAVRFGAAGAVTFKVASPTQITATSPAAAAGTVDVSVTTAGGTTAASSADRFTYVASPAVSGVSPATGSTSGGTTVTITGTNLAGATSVQFGAAGAVSFTVASATQITAWSPAEAAGTVDITVGTSGGTSTASSADRFTYSSAPATITSVASEIDGTNQPSQSTESLSVDPSAAGDLLALAVETKFPDTASFTVSGISGGGVTTWVNAYSFLTSDGFHGQELWYGVVVAPGASTLTVSFTAGSTEGTSDSATSLDLQEFRSSSGASTAWSLDGTGTNDTGASSTTLQYPTLTPSSTSELYFGYLAVPGSLSDGSTPDCVYQTDARGNQIVYGTPVSSTISPTASSSSAQTWASIGMLIQAH